MAGSGGGCSTNGADDGTNYRGHHGLGLESGDSGEGGTWGGGGSSGQGGLYQGGGGWSGDTQSQQRGTAARSFLNGGQGGNQGESNGGFGGGAASYQCCHPAGGAGYGGGGGGGNSNYGGGGSSHIESHVDGSQASEAGQNDDTGRVTILTFQGE